MTILFSDDFEADGEYTLTDTQTSPSGDWYCAFAGFGTIQCRFDAACNNHYIFEAPTKSTGEFETHASMLKTVEDDFPDTWEVEFDMQTRQQLRDSPNAWETAWFFWHYSDQYHYYAFTIKTNGCQLEKKDNMINDDSAEIFLVTPGSPTVTFKKWHHVKIRQSGTNASQGRVFDIWVDGVQVITNYNDTIADDNTTLMSKGSFGLYNEDAIVAFDNFVLSSYP
jgi:hypothetical protein